MVFGGVYGMEAISGLQLLHHCNVWYVIVDGFWGRAVSNYTSQVGCPWIWGVTAMGCLCGTARWQRAYLFSHWGYKSYQPVVRWFDLASSYSPKSKLAGWGDIVDVRCLWLLGARDTAELRHRKWRKQGVNESFARCKYLDWKYVPGKTCLYKLCIHFIFNIFDSLSLNNICFSCRTSFLYCPCRGCCGSSGSEGLKALGSETLSSNR